MPSTLTQRLLLPAHAGSKRCPFLTFRSRLSASTRAKQRPVLTKRVLLPGIGGRPFPPRGLAAAFRDAGAFPHVHLVSTNGWQCWPNDCRQKQCCLRADICTDAGAHGCTGRGRGRLHRPRSAAASQSVVFLREVGTDPLRAAGVPIVLGPDGAGPRLRIGAKAPSCCNNARVPSDCFGLWCSRRMRRSRSKVCLHPC